MAEKSTQTTVSKLVGAGVALAAAWAAQRAIAMVWKAVTGHVPPKAEDDGHAGIAEVAAAAAITGAVAGLARVLATRGTVRTLR